MSVQALADTYTDVAESALVLGVCQETVKRHIRKGTLHGIRFGNKMLIEHAELARFQATFRPGPGSPRVNGAYVSGHVLAEMAGCTPWTVYQAIKRGELAATTTHASYLIERSAAEKWAEGVGDGTGNRRAATAGQNATGGGRADEATA